MPFLVPLKGPRPADRTVPGRKPLFGAPVPSSIRYPDLFDTTTVQLWGHGVRTRILCHKGLVSRRTLLERRPQGFEHESRGSPYAIFGWPTGFAGVKPVSKTGVLQGNIGGGIGFANHRSYAERMV